MSERRNILFLNHVSAMSGAEAGLIDLVKALDRERFSAVVAIPSPGPLADALEKGGARVVHVPLRRFVKTANPLRLAGYLINLAAVVPRLVQLVRDENIAIVHSNSTTAQIYGALAARCAGIPSIWHCRDLVNLGMLGRWLIRSSTRVIAISETVARHLAPYDHAGKVVTLLNGVDVEHFRPRDLGAEVRKELGVPPDAVLVAMAGQLVPWKNHALFLRAASLAAADLPAARFLIVGDDIFGDQAVYRKQIEDLVHELKLTSRVQFIGYRADFARLLEGIGVLVHPADREPFGRVVAEAMAMSKPVVAINSAGPAEIIRNGQDGLLVSPHSPVEIAQAIVRMAKDPALASSIGQAARRRIEADFSLKGHVAKVQTLYESVLTRESRSPDGRQEAPAGASRLACIVGEFPSLSETFVLREILALRDQGFDLLIFSLHHPSSTKRHADAAALLDRVHYPAAILSGRMVRSHFRMLLSTPWRYVRGSFSGAWRGPRGIRDFLLAVDFAALAAQSQVAHLHAHFAFMPTDVAMLMAGLLGRPFSFSAHARDIFTQEADALAGKIRSAAFVMTCTEHGQTHLRRLAPGVPGERIVLAHHGVDPARFAPAESTKPLVLAVGRLEEKKGFIFLLRACGWMAMRDVDFSCIILGAGPQEGALEEELLRCNAGGSTVLQGEVTQEELQDYLRAARVLVAPSVLGADGDRDGIPNVLIEAMAMGVPVVATTTGAIREAVTDGENGLLVPPADPEALAHAIVRLLADRELRRRLGEAGRTRVLKQFDIAKNIATLADLLRRHMTEQAGSGA